RPAPKKTDPVASVVVVAGVVTAAAVERIAVAEATAVGETGTRPLSPTTNLADSLPLLAKRENRAPLALKVLHSAPEAGARNVRNLVK
ncbi:MAG TPA: hypothetical protein PLD59_10400, partial [Tepidisphaeraceae bacterium]|nr:hypothetical protein [Tepidisphaeraceae bacterium]